MSKIISSLNDQVKENENIDQEKTKIYFNQLINLQKQCEFNFSLPIDFYEEMNNFLNLDEFKNQKNKAVKKLTDSYYSYSLANGKFNLFELLETIINFLFNFDLIKGERNQISNQFRTNSNQTNSFFETNEQFSNNQPINFFRFKEGKCLQEMICKLILSPKLEKSLFSNLITILATM